MNYHNVHYNKQLGIIYYASDTSYKLIDHHTNTSHNSSLIDVNACDSYFIKQDYYGNITPHNIIYFNDNVILIYHIKCINKYILVDKRYKYVRRIGTYAFYHSSCVSDQYLYVCYKRNHKKYNIVVYDTNTLKEIILYEVRA